MTNARHQKEQPLYPTGQAVAIIIGIGLVLALLIIVFLVPHAQVAGQVTQHVAAHLNAGKLIVRAPKIKATVHNSLTAAQWHAHHVWHLRHEHAEHVRHLLHIAHVNR